MNDDLILELASFTKDPLGFVLWAFPWGEEGTELEHFDGPDKWQIKLLKELGEGLISLEEALRFARTSGHGIGKSAFVSWIIWWAISTRENTKGVVTANTENQLKTKTWAEVAKWYRLFIGKDLFKYTATAIFSSDPEYDRTWRIDMVPWSERNTEAFAGLHNKGSRILIMFDEASAIPDTIWEVTEGALTDSNTEVIWMAFGNPTKNKGRFRECFAGGKFAKRWSTDVIDSRESILSDKNLIAEWEEDYGEDSDFFRVRVRGLFPRVDGESFISATVAREAANRVPAQPNYAPLILGVDVGRFGADSSVIYPRRGLDARSLAPIIFQGLNTMELASRVNSLYDELHADMLVVDVGGVGGGVVDRLLQLGRAVIPCDFGSGADNWSPESRGFRYANKRAEIWGNMKEWLARGGCIQDISTGENTTLVDELISPSYNYRDKQGDLVLESKREMKRMGKPSPNVADALACTFAYPEPMYAGDIPVDKGKPVVAPGMDYNPYESMNQ